MLFSTSSQLLSPGEPEQTDSGALVIAGDAHFALGRWVRGTVIYSSENDVVKSREDTLTGEDHRSFHYLAYNTLAALPASGKLQCSIAATTAPTPDAGPHSRAGTASGSASVAFGPSGAAIQGTIQVRAGGQSAEVDLSTRIAKATIMPITGLFLANGAGAAVMLADQGGTVPALAVGYRVRLPDGALYLGVARLACLAV